MSIKLIAFLHQSTLRIFVIKDKIVEDLKIDYPETVVQGSEIFDLDKFGFDLKNQLIKRPELKGSEILFLIPTEKAKSLVFSLKGSSLEEAKSRFYTQISHSPEETLLKVNIYGDKASFTAFPKKLLTDVDNVLAKIGFKAIFLPLGQLFAIGFATKEPSIAVCNIDGHINMVLSEKNNFASASEFNSKKLDDLITEVNKIKEESYPTLNKAYLLNEDLDLQNKVEAAGFTASSIQLEGDIFRTIINIIQENHGNVIKYSFDTRVKAENQLTRKFLNYSLKFFAVVFFIALTLGVFLFFKNLAVFKTQTQSSTPKTVPEASVAATPTETKQATPEAMLVNKADLKVRVLNGNGIPGDAGRLKDKLAEVGFSDITAETADKQGQTDTVVLVSARVTASLRDEIKTVLEKNYKKVVISSAEPKGFDIEVTTGSR